ncbi:hypothetical protein AGMMS49587_16330 [Spirochaetia bacterium]|nr:hypothetical protein AGMMS49587_16330 [Spirochaetia bacterium]
MKTNRSLLPILSVLLLIAPPVMAQEESAAAPAKSVKSETSVSITASSLPEAQAALTQSWTFPFLQGEGALTGANNVRVGTSFEVTPVSIFGVGEVTWTPIAFLQLIAGGRIGSGWNIDMFGGKSKGIGINHPNGDGTTAVIGSAFDGVIWNIRAAGLFQFDFAAIRPGDWHHIVFQTQHRIHYDAYSAASKTDSWYTANDDGENRNGFAYYGSFFVGYQMPIFLDTVGLLTEVDKYLYGAAGGKDWGDGLGRWTFSVLSNFTVNKWFSAALITQFRTRRNFTDATKDLAFYQDRRIGDSGPKRHLEFYRVAVIANFKIR